MFCRQCGTQLPDGVKFCQKCGAAVAAANTQAAQPVQQAYQQPVQQAYQQPAQQYYQQPAQQNVRIGEDGAIYVGEEAQKANNQYYQQSGQQGYQQYAGAPGYADPKYTQLGGWLLFFVIMMGIVVIYDIYSVITTNAELNQYSQYLAALGMGAYNTFFMVWSVFVVIECLLMVGLIVLIVMRNDIFLKYYQIVCIVNLVLGIIIMVYAGSLPNIGDSFASMTSSFIGSIGGAIAGFILMTMYYCKSVRVRTYMGSTSYIDKALIKIGV